MGDKQPDKTGARPVVIAAAAKCATTLCALRLPN